MLNNKKYILQQMKNIAMTYGGRYGKYEISQKNRVWKHSKNSDWYTAVDETDKKYYIYVQGSRGGKDWWDNLRVLPIFWPFVKKIKYDYKKLHYGHYQHAKRIFDEEIENVFQYTHQGYTICFRGHSLGGSVANILAFMFLYIVKDLEVITMGSNKSLDKKAQKEINRLFGDKILQIRHKNDLVTSVVPFMKTPGRILQLGKRSKFKLIKNLIMIRKWRKKYDCDHNPKDYVELFEKEVINER